MQIKPKFDQLSVNSQTHVILYFDFIIVKREVVFIYQGISAGKSWKFRSAPQILDSDRTFYTPFISMGRYLQKTNVKINKLGRIGKNGK